MLQETPHDAAIACISRMSTISRLQLLWILVRCSSCDHMCAQNDVPTKCMCTRTNSHVVVSSGFKFARDAGQQFSGMCTIVQFPASNMIKVIRKFSGDPLCADLDPLNLWCLLWCHANFANNGSQNLQPEGAPDALELDPACDLQTPNLQATARDFDRRLQVGQIPCGCEVPLQGCPLSGLKR